jgi:hypothetical protein
MFSLWLVGFGRETDLREKGDKYQHQARPGLCRKAGANETIHASPYCRDPSVNWKNSAFYSAPARRKKASGELPVARRKSSLVDGMFGSVEKTEYFFNFISLKSWRLCARLHRYAKRLRQVLA